MATITINTTGAQDTRIIAAYRARVGDPTATAADVKAWLISHLRNLVRSYETEQANLAASAAVTDIEPT